jgi:hypothetical protein
MQDRRDCRTSTKKITILPFRGRGQSLVNSLKCDRFIHPDLHTSKNHDTPLTAKFILTIGFVTDPRP